MSSQLRFTTRLFYSYSHKDSQHQEKMEKVLTLLRQQDGILKDWSDRRILPGQPISITIKEKMKDTDIFVFLLSFDFIASAECQDEWTKACLIAKKKSVRCPRTNNSIAMLVEGHGWHVSTQSASRRW